MKKIFTLLVLLIVSGFSFAQQIPNNDFENWTTTTIYEDPNGYSTTNYATYTYLTGGNVTKTTPAAHGTYAAKLTTIATSTDTVFGYLLIGTPGNGGINGGIPYTGQPDSVSAYVKYNVKANDTAFLVIAFKKSGVMMAMAATALVGTQSTFKRIKFATGLPATPAPDSLVAIITSSSLNKPRFPGSTLTIDSITLLHTTQQLPNPDFENWTATTETEPDNWATINFGALPTGPKSATKSSSSYSGSYALRLESVYTAWGDSMGFITNGRFGPNGPKGGMKVNANPSKVTGYYKYFPVGNDSALASAICFSGTTQVDSKLVKFPPQNAYTYFELPLTYNSFPLADTLEILFSSSDLIDTVNKRAGSVLYIDDLNVLYLPVGVNSIFEATDNSVFPNPFSNLALISFNNNSGSTFDFSLFDILGNRVMRKETIVSSPITVNRNNLPAGIYEYRIRDNSSGKIVGAGKLMIE
ncbi:MAG TPA: T9SS type A sorting domain-containing protein [Bacteroidia bacterium]